MILAAVAIAVTKAVEVSAAVTVLVVDDAADVVVVVDDVFDLFASHCIQLRAEWWLMELDTLLLAVGDRISECNEDNLRSSSSKKIKHK